MKLLNLRLENFQGIRSLEISPKAQDANIYADNGLGKTTVGNALLWLLTGKPITGAAGYDPKPYGPDGREIHNLDTSVEGSFELDDGRMLTLKRVQRENWRKKRGSQTSEYTGNVTDYYIDGVPAKEKDYIARIEEICPLDRIPLLMLPRHFATAIAWKDRRKMLLDVCGDVSDEDVLDSSIELAKELPAYLTIPGTIGQRYTVDQYREKAAAAMRRINDDLKVLPARIDEAEKAAPELTEADKSILKGGIIGLLSDKNRITGEISTLKRGGDGAVAAQIADLEKELADERAAAYRKQAEGLEAKRAAVRELRAKQDNIQRKVMEAGREAGRLLSDAKEKEQQREMLLRSYQSRAKAYKAKAAEEYAGDTVCPTCGQPLPEDQIETARANFNRAKSEALESIKADMKRMNEKGKRECSKDAIAALEGQIAEIDIEIDNLRDQAAGLEDQINAAQASVDAADRPVHTPLMNDIAGQIAALRKRGEDADEPTRRQIAAKEAELAAVQAKMDAYTAAADKANQRDRQDKRVAELRKQQKELAAEYEKQERGVYLCEQFTRAKVQMLDERINSRFHSVRFRLFETQINGGLKDCCDVMVPGEGGLVPYSSANNAAQINAGIEIIGTLAAHWGASLPIIVDNAESITRVQPSASQIIRLIVSEPDKRLRVEIVPKTGHQKECA